MDGNKVKAQQLNEAYKILSEKKQDLDA